MRFSILAVIVALTASVSVTACSYLNEKCTTTKDCCGDFFTLCDTHRSAITSVMSSCNRVHWHIATVSYIPCIHDTMVHNVHS
ncbi:uncharacterized protein EDB93DRAFT_1175403 [Suillus bovinus]|uniref:uncharacterized protein n=1 Tax=Suillus bovinus TaxID=48563 RepID=UPI001B879E86|nr:uncharacterized protein EDB93DRAFT_1175403 [Suillus bovinus]KAG2132921.1 hypothetical protein EDB93DRAFT_1175403 [Suillus bovinus]